MRVSANAGAVDAARGADHDVILDDDAAQLRHAVVATFFVLREPEPFGADHGPGLDDAAAADLGRPPDDRVGVDDGVFAELASRSMTAPARTMQRSPRRARAPTTAFGPITTEFGIDAVSWTTALACTRGQPSSRKSRSK